MKADTDSPISLRSRVDDPLSPQASMTLSWERRERSRFRARLDDGREAAVVLPREGVLRDGDLLRAECGLIVEVRAAAEQLVEATTEEPTLFARACYHMGNRHVPLQVEKGRMLFKADHVLEALLGELGLKLSTCEFPFNPETGAYGQGGQKDGRGGHSHSPSEGHTHGPADPDASSGPRIHWMAEVETDLETRPEKD